MDVQTFDPTSYSQWSWIDLSGKDSADFLQRLTSCDVNSLQINQGTPGCFLSATGKIISAFWLWRFSDYSFAFEINNGPEGSNKTHLLDTLEKFHFGEDLKISDLPMKVLWFLGDNFSSTFKNITSRQTRVSGSEEIRFCHHGDSDYGIGWCSIWGAPSRLEAWKTQHLPSCGELSANELEEKRISQLSPRVGFEINESTIPLELGMIDSVSRNKGCYPGQEVIERIFTYGSPARRLCLLQGEGLCPNTNTAVWIEGNQNPVGEIKSGVSLESHEKLGGKFLALALIKKHHAKPNQTISLENEKSAQIIKVAPYEKK